MELKPLEEKPEEIIDLIVNRFKKKFGNKLLYVGGKGSLANGNFSKYSDLDLVIVIDDDNFETDYEVYIYNTTSIDIQISSFKTMESDLNDVEFFSWPLRTGAILNLKLFYGDKKYLDKLNDIYLNLRKNKTLFENAITLDSITEYYSKAKRAYENNEFEELNWHTAELWEMFAFLIALLNQRYFKNQGPRKFINQIKEFNYQPKGWEEAFELAISNNYENMIKGSKMIFDISYELSKKHKFTNLNIRNISQLNFKK